jgi:hypothetical protein
MASPVKVNGIFGIGDRMMSIVDVTGPTSYTQITPGVPPAGPTGGQVLSAQNVGLKVIELVICGLDNSGTYTVDGARLPVAQGAEFPNSIALIWVTAASGAQVAGATNLSTFTTRMAFIGR